LPLCFAACNDEEDIVLSQHDNIERYLTSTRRFVAIENLSSVIENNPAFYETFGRYAYRHIVNYYDEGREERPLVEWGNSVQVRFNAFVFSGSEPTIPSSLYWSNVPSVVASMAAQTGEPLVWSSEPLSLHLGTTELIKGLELTLPGCRERDSVQVFMTSSLAYGKSIIGSVPKNSMVAWYMKIEKVTK
jgi:hypothetical protein